MISFNKGVLELSHGDQEIERQVHIKHSVGVKLRESRLDQVDLETTLYKKTSVCFRIVSLDPFVKD